MGRPRSAQLYRRVDNIRGTRKPLLVLWHPSTGQGWWALHIERMVLHTLSRTGSGLHSPKTPRVNRSALLAIASLERLLGVYTIEPAVSAGSRSPTGCELGWSGSTTEVRSLEPDGVEMRQARMGSPIRDRGE
ncbi:hypothetical protein C8F01DRAFT_1086430 [Mycena amicta]|nr:hypothetical protein C8F01DRAFT_1086430 [Mycena amicta]